MHVVARLLGVAKTMLAGKLLVTATLVLATIMALLSTVMVSVALASAAITAGSTALLRPRAIGVTARLAAAVFRLCPSVEAVAVRSLLPGI